MEKALELIKSTNFNGVKLDCYVEPEQQDKGNFWATREQIGRLLEYSDPTDAIAKIHTRHRERLDKFSDMDRLSTPSGIQEVTLYSFKGLLEICRYSQQPNADAVMDVLWEIADEIRRTGSYNPQTSPDVITPNIINSARVLLEGAGITGNPATIALDNLFYSYTGHSILRDGRIELTAPTKHQLLTPTEIGLEFGMSAREVNNILAGAGWQHKIGDKWEPLEPGMTYAVMQDVGKRHGEGTPIRQLKWDSGILEAFSTLAN